MNEMSNELAVSISDSERQMQQLQGNQTTIISTLHSDSFDDSIAIASAVMNAEPLEDYLDTEIKLTNWIAQMVRVTPTAEGDKIVDDDGKITAVRTILIDEDGNAYAAVSEGVVSALSNIVAVLGHPSTWEHSLSVTPKRKKGRNGFNFFTLVIN